jgi:hypothetical protein
MHGQFTLLQLQVLLLLLVLVVLQSVLLLLCRHAAVRGSTARARASAEVILLLKVVKVVLSAERALLALAFILAHTTRYALFCTINYMR